MDIDMIELRAEIAGFRTTHIPISIKDMEKIATLSGKVAKTDAPGVTTLVDGFSEKLVFIIKKAIEEEKTSSPCPNIMRNPREFLELMNLIDWARQLLPHVTQKDKFEKALDEMKEDAKEAGYQKSMEYARTQDVMATKQCLDLAGVYSSKNLGRHHTDKDEVEKTMPDRIFKWAKQTVARITDTQNYHWEEHIKTFSKDISALESNFGNESAKQAHLAVIEAINKTDASKASERKLRALLELGKMDANVGGRTGKLADFCDKEKLGQIRDALDFIKTTQEARLLVNKAESDFLMVRQGTTGNAGRMADYIRRASAEIANIPDSPLYAQTKRELKMKLDGIAERADRLLTELTSLPTAKPDRRAFPDRKAPKDKGDRRMRH